MSLVLEKTIISLAALVLTYLTWVWSGLRLAWLPPAVYASLALLILLLVSAVMPSRAIALRSRLWWRDPFFYFGLLFLGYLTIQWWNAGRIQYYDVGYREWRYSPPHHSGWPYAFSKSEAAQMLYWFFPAWVLGLAVRSPVVSRQTLSALIQGLVYGAGLLAVFGIVQFLTRTHCQYWLSPNAEGFFASFSYTNHAAAYFVLMGAMAAGLLFQELFRKPPRKHPLKVALLTTTLLLCLVGANLSLSRAGVILAWALAAFIAFYGLIKGWRKLRPAGRVNLAAATLAVVCIFYFAVAGFGSGDIAKEFTVKKPIHHVLFPVLDDINLALSNRPQLDMAAWQIWQDNKLLGVGGWGFRYLVASYRPKAEWEYLKNNSGSANVHCDLLQFLTEFGIVGFGLMMATVGTLLFALFQREKRPFNSAAVTAATTEGRRVSAGRDPLWFMGVIGLSLVVIFSLIDLPFRCPAILCTWVVILAAIPTLTARGNLHQITNNV